MMNDIKRLPSYVHGGHENGKFTLFHRLRRGAERSGQFCRILSR